MSGDHSGWAWFALGIACVAVIAAIISFVCDARHKQRERREAKDLETALRAEVANERDVVREFVSGFLRLEVSPGPWVVWFVMEIGYPLGGTILARGLTPKEVMEQIYTRIQQRSSEHHAAAVVAALNARRAAAKRTRDAQKDRSARRRSLRKLDKRR